MASDTLRESHFLLSLMFPLLVHLVLDDQMVTSSFFSLSNFQVPNFKSWHCISPKGPFHSMSPRIFLHHVQLQPGTQPSRHVVSKFLREFLKKQSIQLHSEGTIAINSRLSFLAAPRGQFLCVAERSKFHQLLI